ncbi:MAG TPA: magnesium/cobalt transporter CorA [Thermomicrobiales bacterium]|nr:magnesium/cobalt transporter CorA [Thermomicrobiales bacterium]
MIDVRVYSNGRGVESHLPVNQISDTLEQDDHLVWVDVVSPTEGELTRLGEEFGFHPLAMEDATKRHQRPKVDFYDDFLFIVFYALDIADGRPQTREMAIFAGKNYLVTVRDAAITAVDETVERWRGERPRHQQLSVGLLIYSLLDAIVDDYFPVIDWISEQIEDLEVRIFDHYERRAQAEIFGLKKNLLAVRRVLAPERDVMNVLVRPDSPVFGAETVVYFQDVYDHILRVTDAVDTYRDLLSSSLDALLSITSNHLNQIVKTLTSSSIILMTMTLVAGIYGMNFDNMPELSWHFGYLWSLGLMAAIGVGLFIMFRRMDWF